MDLFNLIKIKLLFTFFIFFIISSNSVNGASASTCTKRSGQQLITFQCPHYPDAVSFLNKQARKATYCCGNEINRYCCTKSEAHAMNYNQNQKGLGKSIANTALFVFITIILIIACCVTCCGLCVCYLLKKGKNTLTRGIGANRGATAMSTTGSCVTTGTCGPAKSVGGQSVHIVNDPSSIYPHVNPSINPANTSPMAPPMPAQTGHGMQYPGYPMPNLPYPSQPNIYPNAYQTHPPDHPPPYNPYYPQ